MTGKNVRDWTGPGRTNTARIRGIMREAPVCPWDGRGTSGNDIIHSARKSGSIQPPVHGEEYLHGITGMQRRSLHILTALHRKLFILVGVSRNGKATLEGLISHLVSRHLEECRKMVDMILEESLPDRPQKPIPYDRGSPPVGISFFVSETIASNI